MRTMPGRERVGRSGISRREALQGTALAVLGGLRPGGLLRAEASRGHPGAWLQLRGDRALTGRSPLKGDIKVPAVRWKQFLGARETLLHVSFRQGEPAEVPLPSRDQNAADLDALIHRWRGIPSFDLEGDTAPAQFSGRTGKFLRDRPGLQTIEYEIVPGETDGYVKLMTRVNRRWVPVWRSERITDQMQGLNTLVGDFDNDGRLEIAFVPWTHLWVLDLATGKTRAKGLFYQPDALGDGRGYGWFGAYDLDGDGKKEFIILSDTQAYISVLGWKGGRFGLLWGRKYQTKSGLARLPRRGVSVRPGPNPVEDVDGDGLAEIVFSYFTETQAADGKQTHGRWHTVVLEGPTGRVKFALADERLDGLRDIDGDGVAELFCSLQKGQEGGETRGRLALYSCKGGKVSRRWQRQGAAFQTQPIAAYPASAASGVPGGSITVLTGPVEPGTLPAFFTVRAADERAGLVELTAWRAEPGGRIKSLGRLTGPHLEALATRDKPGPEAGLLMRVQVPRDAQASLRLASARARPLGSRRVNAEVTPAVVARLRPEAPPAVVVQQAGERIVALQPPVDNRPAKVLWDIPGRGMHEGDRHRAGGEATAGVNLADLFGDGCLATVLATRGPADQARLVAVDPEGKAIWHKDWDFLPGAPPLFTGPGLAFWFAGHFTDPRREDILAAVKSGVGTRLVLLDGRTGKEIWNEPAGGMYMAVYDHDGDGLDDALTTCWSEVRVLHGATGRTLLELNTSPPTGIFAQGKLWPADAYSCAADLLGNGKKQILYWPSYAARGLIDASGKLVWEEAYFAGIYIGQASVYPGLGDLDGDGRLELLSPGDHTREGGQDQICRCYDGATGKRKWELALAPPPGRVGLTVTADLDGDGRDECLFPVDNTLYAIGTSAAGRSGEIRWKLTFPARLGPPAIADVEGNGKPQIVIGCEDGYLYGLGNAAGSPKSQ